MQYGATPFLRAAEMGHVEVAGFLMDNGSSILEQTDVSDLTLLITKFTMQFAIGTNSYVVQNVSY